MIHQRKRGFDNVRCLLLLLVVFAHFLEPSGVDSRVYKFIYIFHIPSLAFFSGWFSSFRPRKLLFQAKIYLIFQFLYQSMNCLLLQKTFSLNISKPYWLLWYLPFLILCSSLVPLLERFPRFPALTMSVILSIATGFFPFIGYDFTLSRFFVFLPYYILGHKVRDIIPAFPCLSSVFLPLLTATTFLSLIFTADYINPYMLYGSFAYFSGYGPILRGLLYLPGTAWCLTLMTLARKWDTNVPVITAIGSNTLPLYLFHGFVVKLIAHFAPLPDYPGCILPALGLTAALLLLFFLPKILRKQH